MIIKNVMLLFKLLSVILKQVKAKKKKVILQLHNNYLNLQVRKQIQIKIKLRNHGVYLLITTMIRNVITKGPKIFMTVKMFIVVEKIKMLLRFSLLKVR